MIQNAFYHAHSLSEEKRHGIPVQLPEGKKVLLQCAWDEEQFGISITDFEGKLTVSTVLKTLKEVIENNDKMIKAIEEGEDPTPFMRDSGRGFQIALEGSDEFYVNIKPNQFTQVIILIWLIRKTEFSGRSLKINEILK